MAVPRGLQQQIEGWDEALATAAPPCAVGVARRVTLARVALGACLALALATVALYMASEARSVLSAIHLGLTIWSVAFLAYPIVGALILRRDPGHRIGWLLCATGLIWLWSNFAEEYGAHVLLAGGHLPAARYVAWTGSFYPFGLWIILSYLLLVFPTGRPLSARWRPIEWIGALGALGASLGFAFGQATLINGELGDAANPFALGGALGSLAGYAGVGFFTIFPAGLVAVASMIVRLRRSVGIERLQLKWIAYDTAWIGALFCVHVASQVSGVADRFPLIELPWLLSLASLPVVVGVAILRYRLFDIDVVINRTLVYLALTACVVALYVGLVGILGAVLRGSWTALADNLPSSLLATGIVAVLFQPLRDRLQRGVNRLLYGERDEPYAVLSRLGARLEATLAPDAVLPAVAQTVVEALKLPYAAIVLRDGAGFAAAGTPGGQPVRLPLVYQHEAVGELLVAPRTPGERFSAADLTLLAGLARQAGVAAHAVRLTGDLQRARERLVTAREEERRRLRRDLHDGLGAQLAGLVMQTGALRRLIRQDAAAAEAEADLLRVELRRAIADIRQLVHGLRPPALDELGVLGALHERLTRYNTAEALAGEGGQELAVTLHAPAALPALPAAVEVAVYRIVEEALTNVVKHAHARRCEVRMALDRGLNLEITDDGIGLGAGQPSGVGLVSIRERAAELGGTCEIGAAPDGGTALRVWLPLPDVQADVQPPTPDA